MSSRGACAHIQRKKPAPGAGFFSSGQYPGLWPRHRLVSTAPALSADSLHASPIDVATRAPTERRLHPKALPARPARADRMTRVGRAGFRTTALHGSPSRAIGGRFALRLYICGRDRLRAGNALQPLTDRVAPLPVAPKRAVSCAAPVPLAITASPTQGDTRSALAVPDHQTRAATSQQASPKCLADIFLMKLTLSRPSHST